VFDYGIGMVSEATTIGELLEGCDPDALDLMAPAELARYGEAVLGLWPRLESARLRLVAALDRTQAYRVDGARDMPSWLAWRSGERRSTARRDVDLATAVSAMPAVSDGLADGVLSKSKAAELTRASAATPEQQAALVAAATTASAEDVARRVDRWQLEHSASPPVVDEDLTVTPVPGGARVQATIDTEGAEWVQVAVDAAADRLGLRDVAGEDGGRAVSLPSPGTSSSTPMCPRREWAGPPWWSQSTWRPLRRLRAARPGSIPAPTCQATRHRRLACDAGVVRMLTDARCRSTSATRPVCLAGAVPSRDPPRRALPLRGLPGSSLRQ